MAADGHPAIHVQIRRILPAQRAVTDRSAPDTAAEGGHAAARTPLIDIYEGKEGLVLVADLPGAAAETVSVQVEGNVLTLLAGLAHPPLEGTRVVFQEFVPAPFARSFILSDEVDRANITAEFDQGVLRLHLPRAERLRTRRIEIKTG